MATTINASTSAGLVSTADTSGVLQLQTAGTTAVSVSAAQVVNFTNAPTVGTLTSGRVTYAGTSGVLQDSANLTFDGTNLSLAAGNLVIGTSGKGIDFSATSGAGTSELLNDYEEGTWTPAYGSAFTGTYASNGQVGRYTKIGRFVCVYIWLQASTISGSGALTVTGLPFAPVTATNYNPGGVIFNAGNWGTNTPFSLDGGGSTTFNIKYRTSANGSIDTNNSAVSDMASNCFMRVSVVYETSVI
jgi:hypothetical protein